MASKDRRKEPGEVGFGMGGILNGLADLVRKLDELSDSSGEMSKTGEFGGGREMKGVYGFTVKVGPGERQVRVEPFGNVRKDAKSGRTVVHEIREPVVDIFEEGDHVLVLAEMPGVSAEDVHLEIDGDLLTITAERRDKKYRKEVRLPGSFTKEKIELSCNNGVVEIRCLRSN